MTNDTTRAMPTVEEIEAMANNRNNIGSFDWPSACADMLRAIADQMRKSEPVAWLITWATEEGPVAYARIGKEPSLKCFSPGTTVVPLYATPRADAEDARRYRWLCNQGIDDGLFIASGSTGTWGECGHSDWAGLKNLLDQRIDSAMKEDSHD